MQLRQSHAPERSLSRVGRFLSLRSVLIGILLCLVVGVFEPYLTIYMSSSYLFTDYHLGGATFFVLALLLFVNLLPALLWRRVLLSQGELLVIVAMVFAGGSVATSGGTVHLIPLMSSAQYYASPANNWHQTIVPYIPKWLMPYDPGGGTVAIRMFWEGVRPGQPMPWGPWVRPLALWAVYLMATWGLFIAVMMLMRKQWVDYEHLSYPIAQVPEELCGAAANPSHPDSIFRSGMFWLGFVALFVGYSLSGISHYAAGTNWRFQLDVQAQLTTTAQLRFFLHPAVLTLVFLIPNRIALSVWVMAFTAWLLRTLVSTKYPGLEAYVPYGGRQQASQMAMGAVLAFVLSSLWYSRQHLRRAVRCGLGFGDVAYDREEPASYRAMFITIALCLVVMGVWLTQAGMALRYTVLFLCLLLCIHYTVARVIAQVGLPSLSSPAPVSPYMRQVFGAATLSRTDMAMLGLQQWNADLRNTPASGSAHGARLVRRRGIMWLMLLSVFVVFATASVRVIHSGYLHGAANLNDWFIINSSRSPWWRTSGMLAANQGFQIAAVTWSGVGAAMMGLLIAAQRIFFWWPLHPVAFLIAHTHMVYNFWFSVFLAWLIKFGLVKLGGHSAYRTVRRLFIGAAAGSFAAGGVWAVIDLLAREVNNHVFAI